MEGRAENPTGRKVTNTLSPLLRLRQASEVTGIPLWALRSAVWAGELPAARIGGKYLIREADLELWIASKMVNYGQSTGTTAS